jgi:hypothetical protein
MSRFEKIAALPLLVAALAAPAAAAQTQKAAARPSAMKSPASSRSRKPAAHSVSGTLESYDASSRMLTVMGPTPPWTYNPTAAPVWDGSKPIGVEDLSSHAGARVTVKYTEEGGQKSAESVRITSAHTASHTAHK